MHICKKVQNPPGQKSEKEVAAVSDVKFSPRLFHCSTFLLSGSTLHLRPSRLPARRLIVPVVPVNAQRTQELTWRTIIVILLVAVLMFGSGYLAFMKLTTTEPEPPKPEVRGIFFYMYEFPERNTPKNLTAFVEKAYNAGFNVILPFVIHAGGLADYRSKVVPNDEAYLGHFPLDVDPLKVVVQEAHRRGIKVWAWAVGFRTSRNVIEEHPDWGIVNDQGIDQSRGSLSASGYYYLSPASPGAREYIKSYIVELVTEYEVDGINLEDDFGFPQGVEADYGPSARTSFEGYLGRKVDRWPDDVVDGGPLRTKFQAWRSYVVTEFLEEIKTSVKAVNPSIVLSADVPRNGQWAMSAMGVDWFEWVKRDLVDVACPMLYHRDGALQFPIVWVKDQTIEMASVVRERSPRVKLMPCVGGAILYTKDMPGWEWVEAVKNAMRGGAKGVLVFADVCVDAARAWGDLEGYLTKE